MITISKDQWSGLAKTVAKFAVKHAPKIAGYAGIGGFFVAIGLTYKNSADIHEGIRERDYKTIIKKSLPIVATATASAVAIHYGMKESDRRLAAAMAAYSLSDAAYNELRESIDKSLSPKKTKEIEHKNNEDIVREAVGKVDDFSLIENTGNGTLLCCETMTGRLFYSDKAYIDRAINEVNQMFDGGEDSVTLGDLHYAMNIRGSDIDNLVRWHRDYSRVKVSWDAMALDDGTPVATIEYKAYGVTGPYGDFVYIKK